MSRLPSISALVANQPGWGFFLCTEKSLRTGRGGEFFALTLQDATGEIAGRIFDHLERWGQEFDAGEFVKVNGRMNQFNGRTQFVIESIRRVMVGADSQDRREGFREDDLVPVAPRPVDEMWAELQGVISGLTDRHLKALLSQISAAHESRLRTWPAARSVHHAYRGGLLEHILSMVAAGRALAQVYGARADLITAGAILHDIGKLDELDYSTTTSYTREGNLIGHVTLGVEMLQDACRSLPGFPDALRTELTHLVLSHHGSRQFGAPVEPMTLEAFILSAVDELDSRINQIQRALRDDEGEGEFTAYLPRLGRVIWKGAGP